MADLRNPVIDVIMDDGTEHTVRAVNIDLITWERQRAQQKQSTDPTSAPMTWMTFVAWHALARTGAYTGKLTEFETAAVEVRTHTENGDGETVDPTNPAREPE